MTDLRNSRRNARTPDLESCEQAHVPEFDVDCCIRLITYVRSYKYHARPSFYMRSKLSI